jgi:hypothetical protein
MMVGSEVTQIKPKRVGTIINEQPAMFPFDPSLYLIRWSDGVEVWRAFSKDLVVSS